MAPIQKLKDIRWIPKRRRSFWRKRVIRTASTLSFIVNGGKLPFYYVGRPAVDADTLYEQYFRSGVTKRLEYKNPEFDKLIDEEQTTGDMKKRITLLQQAGRILMDDAPFVPLYTLAEIYGVARNVIWKATPGERVLSYEMKIRS